VSGVAGSSSVSAWARRLAVLGVIAVAGLGCTGQDESGQGRDPGAATGSAPDDCGSRIDARIEAREIPKADREYFIGMCQAAR